MARTSPGRRTLIDTCVLLDVVGADPQWSGWSKAAIADALDGAGAVINPLIYAEVCAGYAQIEDVDRALPETEFRRLPLPYEAAFLAGQAFTVYRRRGGARRSPLPDFYIGAHAAVSGYALLTRDAARYRSYFPSLRLISPPPAE